MKTEPKIVFENIDSSDALRQHILDEIAHLEDFSDRITACRVVIGKPEKHHRKGNPYQIRIHIVLPGAKEVVVHPSTAGHQSHDDPMVAIRDAFHAARRQIQDSTRKLRGDVKNLRGPRHRKGTEGV